MTLTKNYFSYMLIPAQQPKINFIKQYLFTFSALIILTLYSEKSFSQPSHLVVSGQTKGTLLRSVPEAEGVSSENIINFFRCF